MTTRVRLGGGSIGNFLTTSNRCRSRCDKPQRKKIVHTPLMQEDIKAAAFLAVLHSAPLHSPLSYNACHRRPFLCPSSIRALHQSAPVHLHLPALPLVPPPFLALCLWYASSNLSAFRRLLMRHLARSSILTVLDDAISVGHLTITDAEGSHYYGHYQKGCNDVQLKVVNENFWLRLMLCVDISKIYLSSFLHFPQIW